MLKSWHREEIIAALAHRGWSAPETLEPDSYEIGEKYLFRRNDETLILLFIADLGAGYTGPNSLEEAVAVHEPSGATARLWLERRPNAKWKQALSFWARIPAD